jgi:hypothetical protein
MNPTDDRVHLQPSLRNRARFVAQATVRKPNPRNAGTPRMHHCHMLTQEVAAAGHERAVETHLQGGES